ncbi:MAG: RodZ domain-containing protein [Leptolyngbyaceae bacterium]|nr:RodZ domain-containing protein [Leptolyngbyaceae bacterium]
MSHLNSQQIEHLHELGADLHQQRQSQSLSLEEVAAKTFISVRLLNALESGQAEILPEPVFVQGFIRRYADTLGLDGNSLAQAFPIHPAPASHPPAQPQVASSPASQEPAEPALPINRFYGVAIALGVLILGAILYGVTRPQPTSQTPTPTPTPSLPTQPIAKPQPSPKALTVPIQVAINLTGQSWVEVLSDGKSKFVGILPKGSQKTWTAQKQLSLVLGNAGAVQVSFNHNQPKVFGKLGEVKEVTFTPEKPASKAAPIN